MAEYDDNFEQTRLTMLAKQHPNIVCSEGQVWFEADSDDRLSGASWRLEDRVFDQATESGFKLQLMELLDIFISYRAQCSESPRKQGIVRFNDGVITVEWLPHGTASFSE